MGINFILGAFVTVAAVTIFRHIDMKNLRKRIQSIPVVGKIILVIFGCLKKAIKLMWGTVVWFFGWLFGLPFFRVIAKILKRILKRIWRELCKFAEEESSAT